jgi:1,4-alpha-glucan branching enzyme
MNKHHRNESKVMAKKNNTTHEQTFAYCAPAAESVQLVGDFTHWQETPVDLRKDANGVWRSSLKLEPGTHYYRFLVDGQWQNDPECTLRLPNPFGSENMIREVA